LGQALVIAPYSHAWPATFATEAALLQAAFRPRRVDVEHIGSTAVPGLGAKPIVDILLGAESLAAIEERILALHSWGYGYVREVENVLPQRRYFVKPETGPQTIHLHAVVRGSPFWIEHLAFRDALRADAGLAKKYLALKMELAQRFSEDRVSYTDGKAAFIRGVLDASAAP
jgi:GrpB-like predicted nucleotidyltransferase (UPF0157 family)